MKKLLFFAILLAPFVTNAAFNTNLSYGQKGSDIYQLQEVLIQQKFLNHSATGYFGMLTLDAVKAYQTANGIPNTGYVGLLTRTSLNKVVEENVASSTEAEKEETGAVVIPTVDDLTTVCPAGFDCTPKSDGVLGGQTQGQNSQSSTKREITITSHERIHLPPIGIMLDFRNVSKSDVIKVALKDLNGNIVPGSINGVRGEDGGYSCAENDTNCTLYYYFDLQIPNTSDTYLWRYGARYPLEISINGQTQTGSLDTAYDGDPKHNYWTYLRFPNGEANLVRFILDK